MLWYGINPVITQWPGNFGLVRKRHVGNGETVSVIPFSPNKASLKNFRASYAR